MSFVEFCCYLAGLKCISLCAGHDFCYWVVTIPEETINAEGSSPRQRATETEETINSESSSPRQCATEEEKVVPENIMPERDNLVRIKNMGLVKRRLNFSFSPLTFPKMRFWPLRKKTTKQPPKFCNCSSFGPLRQKNKNKK